MLRNSFLFFLVVVVFVSVCNATSEQKVIDAIFKDYSTSVRPVRNRTKPVQVLLEMKLMQLLSLDTRFEKIRMYCWYNEIWHDELLYWDPADFDGVDHIFINDKWTLWSPDTFIAQSLIMDEEDSLRPQPIRIDTRPDKKLAAIKISHPCIYEFACKIDVKEFPYDIQTCVMTLYSWTRDSSEIIYTSVIPNTAYYLENLQWRLTNVTKLDKISTYQVKKANGEYVSVAWSEVTWMFEFQRKSGFFIVTLIIPTAILVQVCFLGIFTVSHSDGTRTEKVTLGITTILALSILLLVVGDILPRGSSPRPKINDYFVVEMVILMIALIISVVLIYLHYYGSTSGKPVPCCLKKLLCMCCSPNTKKKDKVERHIMPFEETSTPQKEVYHPAVNLTRRSASILNSIHPMESNPKMLDEMRKIHVKVGQLNQTINGALEEGDVEEEEDYSDEWGKAVSRLEFFFLLLFPILNTIHTFIFTYNKPGIKPPYNPYI